MSMVYCIFCDRQVDTDLDYWHTLIQDGDNAGLAVCNQSDNSPSYTLDEKVDMYYEPANYRDLEE